jgi:hypothetical protein
MWSGYKSYGTPRVVWVRRGTIDARDETIRSQRSDRDLGNRKAAVVDTRQRQALTD